jgi:hypothetical protein
LAALIQVTLKHGGNSGNSILMQVVLKIRTGVNAGNGKGLYAVWVFEKHQLNFNSFA